MVRILAIIITIVVVVGILGTFGYIAVKTAGYMINQHFNFNQAWEWSWADYGEMMQNIFGKANAEEDYFEYTYTVNQYIDILPCVDLWK